MKSKCKIKSYKKKRNCCVVKEAQKREIMFKKKSSFHQIHKRTFHISTHTHL